MLNDEFKRKSPPDSGQHMVNVRQRMMLFKDLNTSRKKAEPEKKNEKRLPTASLITTELLFPKSTYEIAADVVNLAIPNFFVEDDLLLSQKIAKDICSENKKAFSKLSMEDMLDDLQFKCFKTGAGNEMVLDDQIVELIAKILARLYMNGSGDNKIKVKTMDEFIKNLETLQTQVHNKASNADKNRGDSRSQSHNDYSTFDNINLSVLHFTLNETIKQFPNDEDKLKSYYTEFKNATTCNINVKNKSGKNSSFLDLQDILQNIKVVKFCSPNYETLYKGFCNANINNSSNSNHSNSNGTSQGGIIKYYSMLMLNLPLIFKNVLSIEISFEKQSQTNSNTYKSFASSLNREALSTSTSSIQKGKNNKEKEKDRINAEKSANRNLFLIFFLYSYYIPIQMKNLISLKINIPYSFHTEIHNFLRQEFTQLSTSKDNKTAKEFSKKLPVLLQTIKNFHFLEFFEKCRKLNTLEIRFNALDFLIFTKILRLIYQNKSIRSLGLDFFPEDASVDEGEVNFNYIYSKKNLQNFCALIPFETDTETSTSNNNICSKDKASIETLNLYHKLEKNKLIKSKTENSLGIAINTDKETKPNTDIFINKLIDFFEINIDFLLSFLSIRLGNLAFISLNIELPDIIINQAKYICTLHKFLFDFFTYAELGSNSFQTIEINSSNLTIDKRKYQNLFKSLDKLNMNGTSNSNLLNLSLNLKLHKTPEVYKFFPKSLEYLKLGDLDIDTFRFFSENFCDSAFANLRSFHVIISSRNPNPIENYITIKNFVLNKKPKNLEEIIIQTKLYLNNDDLSDILASIPNDSLRVYEFIFTENMIINKKNLLLRRDSNVSQITQITQLTSLSEYTQNKLCLLKYPKYFSIILLSKSIFESELINHKKIIINILNFLKISKEKKVIYKFE